MRHAVDCRLHAARAACFERFARVVEPDVAALHEEVRHVQVVVVDEGDAAAELRIQGLPIHPLKMMLADVVGGMRLAGEDDLHRPPGRIQNPRETLGVLEDQVRPFVAGEPARKADCQRLRLEQRAGGDDR